MNRTPTYMINSRGRRVTVEMDDVPHKELDGWVFKPDAKEEYYPDMDTSINKGKIVSHRFGESIDDTQSLEIIIL